MDSYALWAKTTGLLSNILFPDTSYFVLGVGINHADTVYPISTPDVFVDEPICVTVKLGCVSCLPKTNYTVQVYTKEIEPNPFYLVCDDIL